MMDPSQLIELYGLPGLIIAGLVWWGMQERSDKNRHIDARFEDQKEHTAQIMENARTLDRALDVVGRQRDA